MALTLTRVSCQTANGSMGGAGSVFGSLTTPVGTTMSCAWKNCRMSGTPSLRTRMFRSAAMPATIDATRSCVPGDGFSAWMTTSSFMPGASGGSTPRGPGPMICMDALARRRALGS